MNKEYRINNQIADERIDLINEEGKIERDIFIEDAINRAIEVGMDLVEVSSSDDNKLAICKILNYGKLRYKEEKKKKSSKQITKEIRFGFHISDHDLETKNKNVMRFLEKHFVVKYSIELKGREKHQVEEAKQKIEKCIELFQDKAVSTPLKESYGEVLRLTTILSPKNK